MAPALMKWYLSACVIANIALYCARGDVQHETVSVMGRTAFVYRPKPSSLNQESPKRLPGIFVLHGSGGVPSDMYNLGLEQSADANSFLVIYPSMAKPRSDEWGYAADLPYFEALVSDLAGGPYNLDGTSAFVCGHSAGGTMSLFLQNEASAFAAGAAVEAAVGNLGAWNMSKRGRPTMVIWNHADPVLKEYAPDHSEPAYYNLTVSTLRRHGSMTISSRAPLPTSPSIPSAEIITYAEDASPELQMLSWRSKPGTHTWPSTSWATFGATERLVSFFLKSTSIRERLPYVV